MSKSFSTGLDEQSLPLLDPSLSASESQDIPDVRPLVEDRLIRKVDLRMSILILIYILNCIDRNNAAAARLRGFEEDLRLEGSQFATILSVFYIGYVFMQIPSNIFLDSIGRPSIYLSSCVIIWGAISFFTGFATNVLIARFLLGVVEAAFFPGALYLISRWYKRDELSLRTALLFGGNLISNAFGSLIASGILDSMDGFFGYTAWRWLFFVEGSLTIAVAVLSLFVLPDFPESKTSWLTPSEHELAQQRMREESAEATIIESRRLDKDDEYSGLFSGLRLALTDPKVWWLAASLCCIDISTSFAIYFPTLSATMGYNATISLLLCSPPWIVTTFISLWVSRHSDKAGERCMHVVIPFCVGILGFLLAMSTMNVAVRYFSLFLMTMTYSGFICFFAWASTSVTLYTPKPTKDAPNPVPLPSPSKRAVALAFLNASSHFAKAGASYIWPKAWGPSYNKSYLFCTAAVGMSIGMIWIFRAWLQRLNKELDILEYKILGIGGSELEGERKKGWRYML